MCGRFTLFHSSNELEKVFEISFPSIEPNYNLAPSQPILTISNEMNEAKASFMRWGLIPYWAKREDVGQKMINARAETLHEKRSFKNLLANNRCIIPASSFYEWKKENGKKQPYVIESTDQQVLAFAGLWDSWRNTKTNETIQSCTILTTVASENIKTIHPRMPVVLEEGNRQAWLDPTITDYDQLSFLFQPISPKHLQSRSVSTLVNNPKHNGPQLLETIKKTAHL